MKSPQCIFRFLDLDETRVLFQVGPGTEAQG